MTEDNKTIPIDKLVVYEVPVELIKQYISLAKLFFDNKMWKALEEGMRLILEKHQGKKSDWQNNVMEAISELSVRIQNVESVISTLSSQKEEKPEPKTFGGG